MPDLLSLPNELLSWISRGIHRDEIECFTLSCKTVFALCGDILEKHRSRKRYNEVTIPVRLYGTEFMAAGSLNNHPGQLLIELLADPQILPYISTINVEAHAVDCGFESSDEETQQVATNRKKKKSKSGNDTRNPRRMSASTLIKLLSSHRESIHDRLSNSTCVKNQEQADRWSSAVTRGHQGATIGFILSMLSELRHLKFEGTLLDVRILNRMLRHMVAASHNDETRSQALSRVTILDISRCPEDLGSNSPNLVQSLMQLPSLEKFQAANLPMDCRNRSTCDEAEWTSPLEVIELHNCDTDSMFAFDGNGPLGKCTSLREFRYSGNREERHQNGISFEATCDVDDIVIWLQTNAFHTLEILEIDAFHITCYSRDSYDNEYDIGLRPLRTFRALKTLKLPAVAFRESRWQKSKINQGSFSTWILPLVDVLPVSLETFALNGEMPEDQLRNLFKGFGRAKGTFRQLSEVNLERLEDGESLKREIAAEISWVGVRV